MGGSRTLNHALGTRSRPCFWASCPWPPKLSQSEHENLAHHLSPVNSILCHSRLHSFPLACSPTNTHTHRPPRHELCSCREPAVLERPAEVVQPHTPLIPLYRPVLERESGEHAKRRRVERCRRGSFARRWLAGAENHGCGTRSPAPRAVLVLISRDPHHQAHRPQRTDHLRSFFTHPLPPERTSCIWELESGDGKCSNGRGRAGR